MQMDHEKLTTAVGWIQDADGLLVTAGAGMGVDSGLPDFRGPSGLWRAYPPLERRRLSFRDIANPIGFLETPYLTWGFYGQRLLSYRSTIPHPGFQILLDWAAKIKNGAFIFTSNVDGHFQKAGFPPEQVVECHGTINLMQCIAPCTKELWSADDFAPVVDATECELLNDMPRCPYCGGLARPNILMFNDTVWIDSEVRRKKRNLSTWLASVERLVVIEIGAGTAIPTVRQFSERHGPHVVRINPRDHEIAGHVGIGFAAGALETLKLLNTLLSRDHKMT